ncbi:NLRC3 [Symbiodinium necroappetens]|uniref:NLRC3 protein n=1 Tax=Symbiodinium necroappetens TaxID=1628268 RepID=A0A812VNY6_9DINO|nr:NLRC3 [Symbiodinium necroappetens]
MVHLAAPLLCLLAAASAATTVSAAEGCGHLDSAGMEGDENSQLQTKPAAHTTASQEKFPEWLLWQMKGELEDLQSRNAALEDSTALDCSFVFIVQNPQEGRLFVPVGSRCEYDDSVSASDVVCTASQGPSVNPQSVTSDITPFELQPEGSGVNYMVEIVSNDATYRFNKPDEWNIACRAATSTE